MPKPSDTRKKALWRLSRETLLDAAAKTFLRYGIQGTTIRQIANDAGIALGGLYVYFKSKDELVSAVYERGLSAIASEVRYAVGALPADMAAIDRLEFAIRVHIRAAAKHGDYTPLMESARQTTEKETLQPFLKVSDEYQRFWKELIGKAQSSGALRKDMTTGRFLYVLTGAMTWMGAKYQPTRGPLEPLIDDLVNIFLAKPPSKRGRARAKGRMT
jgi:AcrR family transcriptional regulator